MSSTKDETARGYQEANKQFEALREKWPAAFPLKSHEVRPLVGGAAAALTETFGWSKAYASAVLRVWKFRQAYCRAVLTYPLRINLDGSDCGAEVDDGAREQARAQLLRLAATAAKKKAERERKAAADRADVANSAPAEAPKPGLAAMPVENSETAAPAELPKPRKMLLAGSAAMEAALARRLSNGPTTTQIVATLPAPSPKPAPTKRPYR
jgi:sRNA-binding protein